MRNFIFIVLLIMMMSCKNDTAKPVKGMQLQDTIAHRDTARLQE